MDYIPLLVTLLVIYLIVKAVLRRKNHDLESTGDQWLPSPPPLRSTGTESPENYLKPSKHIHSKINHDEWLGARWSLADKYNEKDDSIFPHWYWDEATTRQINRVKSLGVKLSRKTITKGQASDIIGMYEDPEDSLIEKLKFFKTPTKGLTQTMARHYVAEIMTDPEKSNRWENRKASMLQKEQLKFFGVKPPKAVTFIQATKLIEEFEDAHMESQAIHDWENYLNIIDDMSDIDSREMYGIKKPSYALIRQAVSGMAKEGYTYEKIFDEIDTLVERIIEIKPDIEI